MNPALRLESVGKSFGAVRALEGVSLSIEPGEVVGLMGDNGAGKSTLVRVVAGSFPPSEGELWIEGERVRLPGPAAARERGVEIVYQDLALCDNLTAAANVFLGRELRRRVFGAIPVLDDDAMIARARELFESLRADVRAEDPVHRMSGGQRQAVAIARALLADARIVLLDEPTAAIGIAQVAQVLDLIRRLRDAGVAVVLVSHRMSDVFEVCDRVVVLRRGRKVADRPIADTSTEQVTGLITGAIEAV